MNPTKTYIAFLRGINVGGHHKVPMTELKSLLMKMGFNNCITILNSGNVIFDSTPKKESELENQLSKELEKSFGFPIPTLIRSAEEVKDLIANNPFANFSLTQDKRFYISFLTTNQLPDIDIPKKSEDKSFEIIAVQEKSVFSILDLSINGTPKAMSILEKLYSKNITTRNWKTMLRIKKKLE